MPGEVGLKVIQSDAVGGHELVQLFEVRGRHNVDLALRQVVVAREFLSVLAKRSAQDHAGACCSVGM
jgi:hypothetical protein